MTLPMKFLPVSVMLVATALRGADVTMPRFNSNDIGHPPLSLSDVGRTPTPSLPFGQSAATLDHLAPDGLLGQNPRPSIAKLTPPAPRFLQKSGPGKMPILEPNPSIDYKLALKQPDPAIDFKMRVKPIERDQEPAK